MPVTSSWKTPAMFDVSVWELMWWATAGACVAVLEPGGERDPRKIIASVERHQVTVMHFVPSMLGAFLNELEESPDSLHRLTSLHTVFCSGEALTRPLGAVQPGIRRHRGAQADKSLRADRGDGGRELLRVSLGWTNRRGPDRKADRQHNAACARRARQPLPGWSARRTEHLRCGLARGYRGRDDLTAEAFITDARVPGGRRYRTGDLARWQADGKLAFLGRIDDQVKVRGNRVSPGEVQAVMETCPGVRSAVVIAEPSDTHGTYLIGYFVGENMSVNDIEQHLSQRLPGYMVPTTFVKLDAAPRHAEWQDPSSGLAPARRAGPLGYRAAQLRRSDVGRCVRCSTWRRIGRHT